MRLVPPLRLVGVLTPKIPLTNMFGRYGFVSVDAPFVVSDQDRLWNLAKFYIKPPAIHRVYFMLPPGSNKAVVGPHTPKVIIPP